MELDSLSILKIDGKYCDHSGIHIFNWILLILSCNKDNYLSVDEFEILQDLTKNLWYSCPWAYGKIPKDLYWEKCCHHSGTFIFEWIFFIPAGNKTNHLSFKEFEIRQDFFSDFRVSCHWASEKSINNAVTTLAPILFIGSSSLLQATGTIKSWMGSKFSQIRPWNLELAALESLENPHRL